MASAVDSKKSPELAKDRVQHPSNWLARLRKKNTNANARDKGIMLQEEETIISAMPPPKDSCMEERNNKTKKQKSKRCQQREKKFMNKAKAKVEREPQKASQRKREKIFFSKMGFRKEKVTIQIQHKLVPPYSKFQSAAKGDIEVVEMARLYREQYHRHERPLPLRRVKENINHIVPVHSRQEGASNEVFYASVNSKRSLQWAPQILYRAQNQKKEANDKSHDNSNGVRNRDGYSRSNSEDNDDSDSDDNSDDSDSDNDSDDDDTSLDDISTLISSITMPHALQSPTGKHLIQSLGACFSDVSQAISTSITCTCLDESGYGQLGPKPVESFDTLMDDLIDRVQIIEVMSKDTKIINKEPTIEKKSKCNYRPDSCKDTFAIASDNSATVSATSSF